MYRGAMLNIHKYRLRASSCPDIYRNSMTTIAKENEEVTSQHNLQFLTATAATTVTPPEVLQTRKPWASVVNTYRTMRTGLVRVAQCQPRRPELTCLCVTSTGVRSAKDDGLRSQFFRSSTPFVHVISFSLLLYLFPICFYLTILSYFLSPTNDAKMLSWVFFFYFAGAVVTTVIIRSVSSSSSSSSPS